MKDKEKIRAEIEKVYNEAQNRVKLVKDEYYEGKVDAYRNVLCIFDSMQEELKNEWVKFKPSLNLPKERVSIVYDTHDERKIRYAYGYFQFHGGTCNMFWKDGNEQPKSVKVEDIKYWMPVPPFAPMQEEPKKCMYSKDDVTDWYIEGEPLKKTKR